MSCCGVSRCSLYPPVAPQGEAGEDSPFHAQTRCLRRPGLVMVLSGWQPFLPEIAPRDLPVRNLAAALEKHYGLRVQLPVGI